MNIDRKIMLAGIDLDGTLLRDDKTVSEKSLEAIKNAAENGIHIVPITGRPLSGVPDFIKSLDEVRYIVTSNGAYITDVKENITVYSKQMENKTALKYIRLAQEHGLFCEVFCDGYGYVDNDTMERHIKKLSGTPLYDYIMMSRTVVNSVPGYIDESGRGADELFCIADSPEEREAFRRELTDDGSIKYCEIEDIYIELTDVEVDKGEALKFLCNELEIPVYNTIAFGDGENDLSFMKAAGISVAMENAKQIIKNAADFVTASNTDDGVARILSCL